MSILRSYTGSPHSSHPNMHLRPLPHPLPVRRLAAIGAILFLVVGCGDGTPSLRSVTRDLHAGDFTRDVPGLTGILIDDRGREFDMAQRTVGPLTYLFFGYTSCPDMCPMTMARLGQALDLLDAEERARTQSLFVTLDPDRDSPEQVRAWLQAFGPDMTGIVGPGAEVDSLLSQLGFVMPGFPKPEEGPYEVPHPMTLFTITPDGRVRFGYSMESKAAEIAADARGLLEVAW